MKRMLCIISVLALLGGLAGCGGGDTGRFTKKDLSLYDTVSKKTVSLGMSRDEIEKILGEPDEDESTSMYSHYKGLNVGYKENEAVFLELEFSKEGSASFRTARGININSSKKEISAVYGDDWNDYDDLSIYLDKEFNLMPRGTITVDDEIEYCISFSFEYDDKLSLYMGKYDNIVQVDFGK